MAKKKNIKPGYMGDGQHRKNFINLLEKVAYDKSPWDVFTDFLQLAAISFANTDIYHLATPENVFKEREERYLKIVKSYNEKSREMLVKMLAELTLELDTYAPNDYRDVLGEVFHEMEFQNEWKGQFFTPQHIATMTGKMTVNSNNIADVIKEKGYFTMLEPCTGAGAMIYGAMTGARDAGLEPTKQMLVTAIDIDERCTFMTYIQCSLYGVPAVVWHGNSLTDEAFGPPWFTPTFVIDGWNWRAPYSMLYPEGIMKRKTDENVESPPKKKKARSKPKPKEREPTPLPPPEPVETDVKLGQLSLF